MCDCVGVHEIPTFSKLACRKPSFLWRRGVHGAEREGAVCVRGCARMHVTAERRREITKCSWTNTLRVL